MFAPNSLMFNLQQAIIGLVKGLLPKWLQIVIWTNVGLVNERIYTWLGLDEFKAVRYIYGTPYITTQIFCEVFWCSSLLNGCVSWVVQSLHLYCPFDAK